MKPISDKMVQPRPVPCPLSPTHLNHIMVVTWPNIGDGFKFLSLNHAFKSSRRLSQITGSHWLAVVMLRVTRTSQQPLVMVWFGGVGTRGQGTGLIQTRWTILSQTGLISRWSRYQPERSWYGLALWGIGDRGQGTGLIQTRWAILSETGFKNTFLPLHFIFQLSTSIFFVNTL